ncbi:hypothetical protein PG993_005385 [Apiospora rasikravindrae]|uniref:CHCH domain-containing protein n=1 Tax=Apiospora rasikravindrae TaxID=990691 RepID=A0ABR1TFE8_9PEZI
MSNEEKDKTTQTAQDDDDEPDEWDKRIFSTGCADTQPADENAKMTDCYYDKKDWRQCKKEVSASLPC